MITADTITDEQIRTVLAFDNDDAFALALYALIGESAIQRMAARERCAEIINGTHPTTIECPKCFAWAGWACNGPDYGCHSAGYHPARVDLARARCAEIINARAKESK